MNFIACVVMNYILLNLVIFFIALVVVVPLVRLRVRTGVWGIVIRENSGEVEDIVRVATSAMFFGLLILAVAVSKLELESLSLFLPAQLTLPFGVGLSIAGMILIVIAQAQMGASWRIGIDDEPTELCTTGLYSVVRHPIYTGISLCLLGVVLVTPSPWTLIPVLPGFLLVSLQARLEEQHMRYQHGDSFIQWARRTGRIIPGIGKLPEHVS